MYTATACCGEQAYAAAKLRHLLNLPALQAPHPAQSAPPPTCKPSRSAGCCSTRSGQAVTSSKAMSSSAL